LQHAKPDVPRRRAFFDIVGEDLARERHVFEGQGVDTAGQAPVVKGVRSKLRRAAQA
jgi:hypothetical protein